jgi:hypothetical protein
MSVPGFTAEASLHKTSKHYHAATQGAHACGSVYPAQLASLYARPQEWWFGMSGKPFITREDIQGSCIGCEITSYRDDGYVCIGTRCTNWCVNPPRVVSAKYFCFPELIPEEPKLPRLPGF